MIQNILCYIGIHGPVYITEYLLTKTYECRNCGEIWYEQA